MIKVIIILCISVFLGECSWLIKQSDEQNEFDAFLYNMFVLDVQSDTLTLHYYLSDPEKYGITDKETTLGEYGIQRQNEALSASENYLKRLQSFPYKILTTEQQLSYDILKNTLQQSILQINFMYYNECLGPMNGLQAQLPIILSEYNFYTKEDIDEYIMLLPSVYNYFEDIVQYEREKSKQGLFMSDDSAKLIIKQCRDFIENPEENFLIEYFNEKVSSFNGLTKDEIDVFKDKNENAVLDYIIPSYELLINCLTELIGTGTNDSGLYYYPEGRAYYECLSKNLTGSDKNMPAMIEMLEKEIEKDRLIITTKRPSDSAIIAYNSSSSSDPQRVLMDLKENIKSDFPETVSVNCNIKYVPSSLAKYLSPAMYLTPPIDRYDDNNILVKGSDSQALVGIYTILAHEGYPGHLYQCVYFLSQDPSPIRSFMNFTGYVEGWATYAEIYSYHISGIDELLADYLEANYVSLLCMYARADIGIHYEGWSRDKVIDYINDFKIDDTTAEAIYEILVEEPAVYLPYAIGYLEIMELKEKAELELGDKFVPKEFHRFLLDIGPAQFNIIDGHLDLWMKEIED